ncbi:outer membrane scaffolding protein for murein synthesis (MipA/OmpV family) [Novosphingobium chloroacetimidivorans]|uniref:Outer membrane scaffolding protein for murein synthesis (MipA/OmpV family) n=1 Tax=Novosphingobium chloroacetimidivorans TaxID=1428314 RepID=A0A7W7NVM3_9SPHN|nr:MipA/OmpV family protein [Novosphingobium chloroacetimidivorans]MBB4857272.1 outer membrane scaffolding protein for murein synthesis (MipA/OmpV family) [Novosphingobium chloroacetimidivorans]
MRKLALLGGLTAALVSLPAFAQDATSSDLDADRITIGVGGVYMPSYRGSDDYSVSPVPVIQGQFKGIGINPRAGGVALDFIPDNRDSGFGFSLGPVATYSGNRARGIRDDVVKRVGKLDDAVELGVTAGVTAYKLTNPYDSLSLSIDARWDVAGAYKGMVWTPNLTYATPLSKGSLVTLNVSAHHGDGKFNRYYYSVTPAQSLRTGGALPVYNAKKGWDSVSFGLLGAYDLDGDLLNGGLAIFALGSYSKMLNDGKDTPYTRIRGDADQWIGGLGVAYTF